MRVLLVKQVCIGRVSYAIAAIIVNDGRIEQSYFCGRIPDWDNTPFVPNEQSRLLPILSEIKIYEDIGELVDEFRNWVRTANANYIKAITWDSSNDSEKPTWSIFGINPQNQADCEMSGIHFVEDYITIYGSENDIPEEAKKYPQYHPLRECYCLGVFYSGQKKDMGAGT